MKKYTIVLLFSFLLFTSIPNTPVDADDLAGCEEHIKYGAPSQNPVLLCRLGYVLSHDSNDKVPEWVAYHLTSQAQAHSLRGAVGQGAYHTMPYHGPVVKYYLRHSHVPL